MPRTTAAIVTLLAFFLAAPGLAGTHSNTRDGVVIGLDLGWGWTQAQVTDDGTSLTSDWTDDLTGGFRVGFAPSDELVYGLEIGGWSEHTGLLDESVIWIQAAGRYFPTGQGLWLKAGAGLGSLKIDYVSPAAIISRSNSGLTWNLGLGYEMRVSPTLALGLGYDYRKVSVGEVLTLDDVETTVQSVTFAVTWYKD